MNSDDTASDQVASPAKTILLVDDDAILLRMYSQKLSAVGYRVIEAKDGAEALELAKKEKVNLVLTDIMLPKMSGTDFLAQLRKIKAYQDTPVIAWSNLPDDEVKNKAFSLGAKEYLHKGSLSLDQVADTVKKYL